MTEVYTYIQTRKESHTAEVTEHTHICVCMCVYLSIWCHLCVCIYMCIYRYTHMVCYIVFSNESALHMRWPKYWSFSPSIIPSKEIPGWSPSEWTGWISLQSKGLSRVFSNTTVQKRQDSDAGRDWGARGEGDDGGWDGWMASLTRWTWVSVDSGSW